MTRSRATARQAGTKWETAIVRYLNDRGWPHAERRRLAGREDKGDVLGIPGLVIEAKNTNRLDIAGAVDEANTEKTHAGAAHGVGWIKRRGHSDPADAYVVMDGDTFTALLKEAGY